jgi:hypothetical protein
MADDAVARTLGVAFDKINEEIMATQLLCDTILLILNDPLGRSRRWQIFIPVFERLSTSARGFGRKASKPFETQTKKKLPKPDPIEFSVEITGYNNDAIMVQYIPSSSGKVCICMYS